MCSSNFAKFSDNSRDQNPEMQEQVHTIFLAI